jgi:hypothetical protein
MKCFVWHVEIATRGVVALGPSTEMFVRGA